MNTTSCEIQPEGKIQVSIMETRDIDGDTLRC